MNVEAVRVILERTFQMPVAESDAKIVLDRLNEILFDESRPTPHALDGATDDAERGVYPTGLTSRQKEEVRQMIQSALDTGSA